MSFFSDPGVASPEAGTCKWKGVPVMCGPEGLLPVHDILYRGKGDGTFEDVTAAAHFRPREAAYGLGEPTSFACGWTFWQGQQVCVRSRELHVRVGRPIETRTHTYDDRDLVSAETARQLAELLRRASEH